MQVENCFILGAGFGTRMGEIGKYLPKILWPIFEKTLLEIQIDTIKELGIKNIFLNTHHLHQEVVTFIKSKKLEVEIIHEKELLDSGGAFHNLKRVVGSTHTKFLFLNGDIIHSFSTQDLILATKLLSEGLVLFGREVTKSNDFNQTVIENDRLVDIVPANKAKVPYFTYAGMGLIDLNFLEEHQGVSRFFDTVANYKKKRIKMILPDSYNSYDCFGAKDHYRMATMEVFKNERMRTDFVKKKIIDLSKLDLSNESYHAEGRGILNFSGEKLDNDVAAGIFLSQTTCEAKTPGIYFKEYFDKF